MQSCCIYPSVVMSHCSPGGELSAQADEPATFKCIQCNERCGSEVGAETACTTVVDSQKFDCSIQCTQVSHLLFGIWCNLLAIPQNCAWTSFDTVMALCLDSCSKSRQDFALHCLQGGCRESGTQAESPDFLDAAVLGCSIQRLQVRNVL